MWQMRRLLPMAAILFCFVPGVFADSLQLKNGNMVDGKYMGGTEGSVQFEVNGKMRVYSVDQILSISFAATGDGGVPSKSSTAAAAPGATLKPISSSKAARTAASRGPHTQKHPTQILTAAK